MTKVEIVKNLLPFKTYKRTLATNWKKACRFKPPQLRLPVIKCHNRIHLYVQKGALGHASGTRKGIANDSVKFAVATDTSLDV